MTEPVQIENPTPASSRERGNRRKLVGRVVSDKMQKTIIVMVTRRVRETMYDKYVTRRAKYVAHDEKDEMKVGDKVEIVEHRPLSRTKRWKVVRLIERPAEAEVAP